MTLRELASAALLELRRVPASLRNAKRKASVSASYLSLIENGHKVPDAQVAWALARALGDDADLYAAWVQTRKRADLDIALAAADTLKRRLNEIRASHPRGPESSSTARGRPGHVADAGSTTAAQSTAGPARLRLPIIPEGLDPGEGVRPSCAILEWRGLDETELPREWRGRLDRPFGFQLSEAGASRAPDVLSPGDYVIVQRDFAPLSLPTVYAVRHQGRVIVSRVMWNEDTLLLIPAQGASDFMVISGCGEPELRRLMLGAVFTLGSGSDERERAPDV